MINKIKLALLSVVATLMFSMSAFIPATALAACGPGTTVDPANTNQCLCSGSNIDFTGQTPCPDANGGVADLIRTIINILSIVIGAIAVIMVIIGGFRYITSAGNPEGAKSARQTILYAIIGLVIVALAQVLVHFVLNSTSKVTG